MDFRSFLFLFLFTVKNGLIVFHIPYWYCRMLYFLVLQQSGFFRLSIWVSSAFGEYQIQRILLDLGSFIISIKKSFLQRFFTPREIMIDSLKTVLNLQILTIEKTLLSLNKLLETTFTNEITATATTFSKMVNDLVSKMIQVC